MYTVNTNPAAVELIAAWHAAKAAERQWVAHRQALEEQILSLHPLLLSELEQCMASKNTMSASAQVDSVVIEAKRSLEVEQNQAALVLAEHPDLFGSVLRCRYEVASSKALFGLFATQSPAAEALRSAVTFKAQKPYFAAK